MLQIFGALVITWVVCRLIEAFIDFLEHGYPQTQEKRYKMKFKRKYKDKDYKEIIGLNPNK